MSINRHNVLRHLTDRPGQVVYKNEIMEELNLTASQVTAAVLGLQRSSAIGSEIETLVQGNAWRYRPTSTTATTTSPTNVPTVNGSPPVQRTSKLGTPLTRLIYEYLLDNPNKVVYVSDLMEHTGRSEAQVKVGVSNMRNSYTNIRPFVRTEIAGQAWRYTPPSTVPVASAYPPVPPIKSSRPITPARTPASTEPTLFDATNAEPGTTLMFEEVGRTGDKIVIRGDDGQLYHATRLDIQ